MAQSINLIPKQEVQLQQQKKLLNFSTIFTVVSLLITLVISGILLFVNNNLNNQVQDTEQQISSIRRNIQSNSQIEIVARNLDKKFFTLKEILVSTPKYSNLLNEVYIKKPEGIDLYDIAVRGEDILEINGKADAYLLVAEFMDNISNDLISQGQGYSGLFTQTNLNTVTLESDGASFSLSVYFDKSILTETL